MKTYLIILFFIPTISFSQNMWEANITLGGRVNLFQSIKTWKLKNPGFEVYINANIYKRMNEVSFFSSNLNLSLYYKSLGNSNRSVDNDIQIDFTNTYNIGIGKGILPEKKYRQYRTLHNTRAYSIIHNFDKTVVISTNFIFNNSKRHQIIGSISGTWNNCSISMSNDGGPPINWLPISDNFDRWWTGALGFYRHNDKNYNSFEASFTQFTGFLPLLYELHTLLGADISKYNYNLSDRRTGKEFNSSMYNFAIGLDPYSSINFGIKGNLRFQLGKLQRTTHWGLQDLIHMVTNVALHPNEEENKLYFGVLGYYNLMNYEF